MHDDPKPIAVTPSPERTYSEGVRRIASSDLFGSAREIVIEHSGRLYRMRITQNGKLILTA
jgi:hemin uptake protein HemP